MIHFILGLVCSVTLVNAWVELQTNFPFPRPQPRTVEEAINKGWTTVGDDGCTTEGAAWPGTRMIPPIYPPDMVLIFDADGKAAGMQSGMPALDFSNAWGLQKGNCNNKYYQKDIIYGTTFCLATLYFSDPASICSSGEKTDLLVFQEGPTYKDELLYVPRTWNEAEKTEWENHFYLPRMGHHRFHTEPAKEDCLSLRPVQVLYTSVGGECVSTGVVWQHSMPNPENTGTNLNSWETIPGGRYGVQRILSNPSQCILQMSDENKITTMHVWLGGSTEQCQGIDNTPWQPERGAEPGYICLIGSSQPCFCNSEGVVQYCSGIVGQVP